MESAIPTIKITSEAFDEWQADQERMRKAKEKIDTFLENPDPAEAYDLLLEVREMLGYDKCPHNEPSKQACDVCSGRGVWGGIPDEDPQVSQLKERVEELEKGIRTELVELLAVCKTDAKIVEELRHARSHLHSVLDGQAVHIYQARTTTSCTCSLCQASRWLAGGGENVV